MIRVLGHGTMILLLTVVTQIGGLAWLLSCLARHRLATFAVIYAAMTLSLPLVAPLFGREALTCWARGALQMQSAFYCVLNRNYMRPELRALLEDAARDVAEAYPGTQTLVLDAGFPFLDGFPLLPHLSHDDGGQADLAFFYADGAGFLPGRTPSPIGYFAFEHGATTCPRRWLSLRWDMGWLQPLWPDLTLEPERTAALIRALSQHPQTGRLFIEPHLVRSLGVAHSKIGFQGCRAARHDDHIHVQL